MHSIARASVVGALVVGCVMLAGCDDLDLHGEFDLGFDGQSLLVAICHDAEITEVSVSEYVRDRVESSSRRIWEATGAISVEKGDAVVVGGENAGLNNDLIEVPDIRPGIRYYVKFNDIPGEVPSALFVWPEEGVSDGEWLSTDGTVTSQPCAD